MQEKCPTQCKLRYVVEAIDCDEHNLITPNERVYRIRDLKTDQLGFASYKTKERAREVADKKNSTC